MQRPLKKKSEKNYEQAQNDWKMNTCTGKNEPVNYSITFPSYVVLDMLVSEYYSRVSLYKKNGYVAFFSILVTCDAITWRKYNKQRFPVYQCLAFCYKTSFSLELFCYKLD